jgi:Fe-S cluster assembly protein SufD
MTALQSNLLENHTPTGREEAWRFTPLKRLGGMHDGTAVVDSRASLFAKGELPKGASFTTGEITALTECDDAIINRIRSHTSIGATLAMLLTLSLANQSS